MVGGSGLRARDDDLIPHFRKDHARPRISATHHLSKESSARPLEYYASRCLSPGATAFIPFFVSTQQLQSLASTSGGVAGLTVADFSLSFADFDQQWQRVQTGAPTPLWQFQGGALILQLLITIYVDDRFRGRTDILDIIMEHELLHVKDEIDVLTTDLPAQLRPDPIVSRYLIDRRPVDNAMFENWFKTKRFEDYVQPTWAVEHNRKNRIRDSGMEYAKYINRISTML